jgi:hypothetical protein
MPSSGVANAIRIAQSRAAAVFPQASSQVANLRQREAPIGGLNTRDSFDNMPLEDARLLLNWVPDYGGLTVRKGYTGHATGVGSGDVLTIAQFNNGATQKMIAFSATAAYDATSEGAASSLKTGLTSNGRWDWVNMNGSIAFVDGVNAPQEYDGSTWGTLTISGTGLTAASIVGIMVFKGFSIVWMEDSADFFYSAALALGGTMTKFSLSKLGAVASQGGKIVAIQNWTFDGGAGEDDYFVVIMSTGQVIVYAGTDPSDATKWALKGVYDMGAPTGRDTFINDGGDLMGLLGGDYKRITANTLKAGTTPSQESKMVGAADVAQTTYGANAGWAAVRNKRFAIFNVPVSSTIFHQHVLNFATKAWTKFDSWNARCLGTYEGDVYFGGGGGQVYKAFSGDNDNGAGIAWDCETAWDNLGQPNFKRLVGIRFAMTSQGPLAIGVDIAFDFELSTVQQQITAGTVGAAWDSTSWNVSDWAPETSPQMQVRGAAGSGVSVSARLRGTTSNQTIKWFRTDYLWVPGGVM